MSSHLTASVSFTKKGCSQGTKKSSWLSKASCRRNTPSGRISARVRRRGRSHRASQHCLSSKLFKAAAHQIKTQTSLKLIFLKLQSCHRISPSLTSAILCNQHSKTLTSQTMRTWSQSWVRARLIKLSRAWDSSLDLSRLARSDQRLQSGIVWTTISNISKRNRNSWKIQFFCKKNIIKTKMKKQASLFSSHVLFQKTLSLVIWGAPATMWPLLENPAKDKRFKLIIDFTNKPSSNKRRRRAKWSNKQNYVLKRKCRRAKFAPIRSRTRS